jgi:hypothetical protein
VERERAKVVGFLILLSSTLHSSSIKEQKGIIC